MTLNCKSKYCDSEIIRWKGYCQKHYRQLPEIKKRDKIKKHDWYIKNCDLTRKRAKKHYYKNIQNSRKRVREKQQTIKTIILWHYSGGTMRCICCGINGKQFLTLEHIGGGGNKHRKEIGKGSKINWWLLQHNLPKGFEILCWNCNCAKGMHGFCH